MQAINDNPASFASTLVNARRAATSLAAYSAPLPGSLADAYAVQAEVVRLWGSAVVGWKIGRITGGDEQRLGKDRFIGPIFAETLSEIAAGEEVEFPVIAGGSAALEAEVVAVLGLDIAPERTDWSAAEIAKLIARLHIGIEVAGCPVPAVNELGPLASIACFGNNLGLLLGPVIADGQCNDIDAIGCRATIDGTVVGDAIAGKLPGGPLAAVAFALNQAAELGIALSAGTLLSTGAITGVHNVMIGQHCTADFDPWGLLHCETVAARPG